MTTKFSIDDDFKNMIGNGAAPHLYSVKLNGVEFYNARYVQSSSYKDKRQYSLVFVEYEDYKTLNFLHNNMNKKIGYAPTKLKLEITFFKRDGEKVFTLADDVYVSSVNYQVDYSRTNEILEISATLVNNAD